MKPWDNNPKHQRTVKPWNLPTSPAGRGAKCQRDIMGRSKVQTACGARISGREVLGHWQPRWLWPPKRRGWHAPWPRPWRIAPLSSVSMPSGSWSTSRLRTWPQRCGNKELIASMWMRGQRGNATAQCPAQCMTFWRRSEGGSGSGVIIFPVNMGGSKVWFSVSILAVRDGSKPLGPSLWAACWHPAASSDDISGTQHGESSKNHLASTAKLRKGIWHYLNGYYSNHSYKADHVPTYLWR